jgi:cytochrome c oxidase subunit II
MSASVERFMTLWSMGSLSDYATSTLDPRGPAARSIANLWWVMFAMGLGVYLAVSAAILVSFLRRRRNRPGPMDRPIHNADERVIARRRWIVYGGVVMPAVVLVVVFGAAVRTTSSVEDRNSPTTLTIDVIAHQWWWEMRYDNRVTTNELHIPSNERVLVRLRSDDVIHSLWIPQLNGKIDALPDHINTIVLEADEPGIYQGRCAEFCGLNHAKMPFVVIVHPRPDFDAWLASQP